MKRKISSYTTEILLRALKEEAREAKREIAAHQCAAIFVRSVYLPDAF
jgi:hypothetical protein